MKNHLRSITTTRLLLQCGIILASLLSAALVNSLMAQIPCSNLTHLDFATDGSGNPFSSGMVITNQLHAGYGISVQATNDRNSNFNIAMIFDSSNPTGGDTDLGTPHTSHNGPGVGSAGASTNTQALGNLLIISEDGDSNDPDDEAGGGKIRLDFAVPTYVHSMKVVDIDRNGSKIKVIHNGSQTSYIPLANLGDNSVQSVPITQTNVTRIVLILCGSGAMADLTFCDPIAPMTLTVSGNDSICHGGSTTLHANVQGGLPPYSYAWQGGGSGNSKTVNGGNWNVTVTDNLSNICTANFPVMEPSQPVTISAPGTSQYEGNHGVSCASANDGWINCSVSGGFDNYNYQWSNNATTANIANLTAGTYTVTVTDAFGCQDIMSVNLTAPAPMQLSLTSTSPICGGVPSGTISTNTSGGVGNYSYAWSTGDSVHALQNLPAGSYSVTVTDPNHCQVVASTTITEPTPVSVSFPTVQPTCSNTGSVSTTAAGGAGNFSYLWSNGATTSSLNNLTAGNYTVTVTDQNGCERIDSIVVPQLAPIAVQLYVVQPICGNAGSISAQASGGGSSSYTYLWSNGDTTSSLTNLSTGNYTVTVTNPFGCETVTTTAVIQSTPVTVAFPAVQPTCTNTGSITTQAGGGLGNYTYLWSNGATTSNLNNLTPGSYAVTVTDSLGCEVSDSITVPQPTQITVQVNIVQPTCSNPGSISALASGGGTNTYSYLWSNGATTSTLNNPTPGNHTVTVTNVYGCEATAMATIVQAAPLSLNFTAQPPTCELEGSISASVVGGTPPFQYSWSNGDSLAQISAGPGTYSLLITDANGCTVSQSHTLAAPAQLGVTLDDMRSDCAGNGEGAISIATTHPGSTLSYNWSNGSNSQNISGLTAGSYTVTITDNQGSCPVEATFAIPAPMEIDPVVHRTTCPGQNDGHIALSIAGGTAPYMVLWSNGDTATSMQGLSAGHYNVQIADDGGCLSELNLMLEDQPAPVADAGGDMTAPICQNSILVSALLPAGNTNGTWSTEHSETEIVHPDQSTTMVNLTEGITNQLVWTVDRDGCTASDTINIAQKLCGEGCANPILPTGITPNADGANDIYIVQCLPEGAKLMVMNRWGNKVYEAQNYQNDWTGKNSAGEDLAEGTYFVLLEYKDKLNQDWHLKSFVDIRRDNE